MRKFWLLIAALVGIVAPLAAVAVAEAPIASAGGCYAGNIDYNAPITSGPNAGGRQVGWIDMYSGSQCYRISFDWQCALTHTYTRFSVYSECY